MDATQLRMLRQRYGFTQGSLGLEVEKSLATIYRYENGRTTIPRRMQLKLAIIFHLEAKEHPPRMPCSLCGGTGLVEYSPVGEAL